MTETERRRRELLEQTRSLYQDKSTAPAVHPRYGNAYKKLYGETEELEGNSSLWIRIALALICFVVFAGIDYTDQTILNYKPNEIVEVLSSNIISEYIDTTITENNNDITSENENYIETQEESW